MSVCLSFCVHAAHETSLGRVNYGESLQNAVEREVSGTRAGPSVLYNLLQVLEETGLESVANERMLHKFFPFHFLSA